MKDKLKQAVGNVVTGERFWDRETELELLTNKIDAGANILLVAQRRIGKTSVLAELHRRLSNRYTCLFVDLQAARSNPDAVAKLSMAMHDHKPLSEKTREVFANVLKTVTDSIEKVEALQLGATFRAGLTAGDWMVKGNRLFDILGESATEKPVVIMFDEMPIMINYMLKDNSFKITPEGKKEADAFLSWLRQNCIKHQGKVRVIVAGSIGLEPILRQARLSATINHFTAFELKPWDETTSVGCINALANEYGVELKENVAKEMVNRLGCGIPHHVQMFFSYVYDHCKKKGKMACNIEEVGEIFEREMLGIHGHPELTHYEERLEMVLGKELFTFAIDMLTEAAVTGYLTNEAIRAFQKEYSRLLEGVDIVEAQKEILWVLEHDGYIQQSKNGYVFVSKLLRQWWKNLHGSPYTFIPILKRGY